MWLEVSSVLWCLHIIPRRLPWLILSQMVFRGVMWGVIVYAILSSVSISSFCSCYFVNFILKNPSLFVMFINCLHVFVSVLMCSMSCDVSCLFSILWCCVKCCVSSSEWIEDKQECYWAIYDVFTSSHEDSPDSHLVRWFSGGDVRSHIQSTFQIWEFIFLWILFLFIFNSALKNLHMFVLTFFKYGTV